MTEEEVDEIILTLQTQAADTTGVEAKRSADALPRSVRETLSSFSNSPGGGIIVLGVDESTGFAVTGLTDPGKIQAAFTSMCTEMTPILRPIVGLYARNGTYILVAEIPELPDTDKPCYYTGAGIVGGSYIRNGDADQRLTSYEVMMMRAKAGRPREDLQPISDCEIDVFDHELLDSLVDAARTTAGRVFGDKSVEQILKLLRAAVEHDGKLVPTLAGYLALGTYPQQHFANLAVTFVEYPTLRAGEVDEHGRHHVVSRSFSGPLPVLVFEVLDELRSRLTKGSFGGGVLDHWPYPQDAMQECVVNALVHRDYSPLSQGTAVQIELYPDRLLIKNPGGLFGTVHLDELGEEGISSTRNEVLVRLLELIPAPTTGVPICQNRGTGIPTMLAALRQARMRPPTFKDRVGGFEVYFAGASLFSTETLTWLGQFRREDFTETQRVALALAHTEGSINNAGLRRATGEDSRDATVALTDLVDRSFLVQEGVRRWTSYSVAESYELDQLERDTVTAKPLSKALQETLNLIDQGGDVARSDVEHAFGLSRNSAKYRLDALRRQGYIELVGEQGSKTARYRSSVI